MTLRIGYIGTGSMGRSHIQTFRDYCAGDAQGVAMFDPHPPSIEAAQKLLPDAAVCDSAEALLASDVDAVVVSTPNVTHRELATAALSAGKHVLSEKPVAATVEDCRLMVEAANATDRVLAIGHEYRYSADALRIKELIDTGAVGTPQYLWCWEFRPPFLDKVDQWIIDQRFSGGMMVDKNCHHFDLMNWWLGARATRVGAFGCKRFNNVLDTEHEVIDNASVSFEYDNGAVGALMVVMFAPDRGMDCLKMGVIGDEGMIELQAAGRTITVWPRHGKAEDAKVHRIDAEIDGFGSHTGFVEQHSAFVEACRNGTRPASDVRNCVEATLLAIAAEQAIKEGRVVDVPEL